MKRPLDENDNSESNLASESIEKRRFCLKHCASDTNFDSDYVPIGNVSEPMGVVRESLDSSDSEYSAEEGPTPVKTTDTTSAFTGREWHSRGVSEYIANLERLPESKLVAAKCAYSGTEECHGASCTKWEDAAKRRVGRIDDLCDVVKLGSSFSGLFQFDRHKARLGISATSWCGPRTSNEDRFYVQSQLLNSRAGRDTDELMMVGVFDGHGGMACSEFLTNNVGALFSLRVKAAREANEFDCRSDLDGVISRILCQTVADLETQFFDFETRASMPLSGSTGALTVFCVRYDIPGILLVTANIGDSRGLLFRKEGLAEGQAGSRCCEVVQLTKDQTGLRADEKARVQEAGGFVEEFGSKSYVGGGASKGGRIGVSRAFGDREFKIPKRLLICVPEVTSVFLSAERLRDQEHYVVLLTDGVWDAIGNDTVAHFLCCQRSPRDREDELGASREVVTAAALSSLGSGDNMTAAVVQIHCGN